MNVHYLENNTTKLLCASSDSESNYTNNCACAIGTDITLFPVAYGPYGVYTVTRVILPICSVTKMYCHRRTIPNIQFLLRLKQLKTLIMCKSQRMWSQST